MKFFDHFNIRHEISGDLELLVLFCDTTISVQVDTATDNHNDNAIFTEEDEKIVNIVAELLGIDTENLKQVELWSSVYQELIES